MRTLVEQQLALGQAPATVLEHLERVRQRLRDQGREADEDVVMDVMDCLTGWCGPHARLEAAPRNST